MKRNSMIEMPEKYSSPFVIVVAFKPEGHLCQSQFGSGNEGFVEDPDMEGGIDF